MKYVGWNFSWHHSHFVNAGIDVFVISLCRWLRDSRTHLFTRNATYVWQMQRGSWNATPFIISSHLDFHPDFSSKFSIDFWRSLRLKQGFMFSSKYFQLNFHLDYCMDFKIIAKNLEIIYSKISEGKNFFVSLVPRSERRRGRRPKETCGAWWAFANKAKSGENLSKNPEKIFRENLVKIIINIKPRNTLGGYGSKAI